MVLSRLLYAWLRPTRPALDHLRVTMYTRRGCHLCERAWQQLQAARQRYSFALAAVDVDDDLALAQEHGDWVPVVAVNGKVRFRGTLNPVLLTRLLEAEAARKGRG